MPKTVEVDEEDFRANAAMRDALAKISKHPKAKLLMQEAHKLADPENARTPDLDQQEALKAPISAIEKKLDDFLTAQKESAAKAEEEARERKIAQLKADQDAAIMRLRSSGRWTDKGIEAIKETMASKGILDVNDAAAIVERSMPPAAPVTPHTGAWGFADVPDDGDADIKSLLSSRGENDALLGRMAHKALVEVRGR